MFIVVFIIKPGIKNRNSVFNRVGKISDFCRKQGQGMRGRAAPPHPRIYRVPVAPGLNTWTTCHLIVFTCQLTD